jgi:sulfonate transport system substrate-binding protein
MIALSRRAILAAAPLLLARPAFAASPVLRMGDQRGNMRALMEAAGLLKDMPYTVEWSEFAAAAPLAEAMSADAIDGGITGDAPFTFAFAAGVPIKAIAVDRYDPQGTAIVVSGASPVTDAAGLKGKRVATGRGSIGHSLVLAVMKKNDWTKSDVTVVFLQPADAKAALANGAIDAWSTWEPYTSQVEILGGERVRVAGRADLFGGDRGGDQRQASVAGGLRPPLRRGAAVGGGEQRRLCQKLERADGAGCAGAGAMVRAGG